MSDAAIFFRSLIFFCAGCLLLMGDALWLAWTALFIYIATPISGVVDAQPNGGFHPVVRFTTSDGIEALVPMSSGFTWVDVGQQVPLLYFPSDVYSARIDAFGSLWGFPLMMGFMGMVFIVVALGTLWAERRNVGS